MAQGQSSSTTAVDAPDTLPGDFFDKKKQDSPDTLPADFFNQKAQPNQNPNLPGGSPKLQELVRSGAISDKFSKPTQFEAERSGRTGVSGALKNMLPPDPTGGHGLLSQEGWFGNGWHFNPRGPGTAIDTLTRPLPADLPTEVLSGGNKTVGNAIYRGAGLLSPLAGASPEEMETASARGDTLNVATQAAVPIGSAILGAATPAIASVASDAGRAIGSWLVDSSGKVKPIPRMILGSERAGALGDLLHPQPVPREPLAGGTSTKAPIGNATLPNPQGTPTPFDLKATTGAFKPSKVAPAPEPSPFAGMTGSDAVSANAPIPKLSAVNAPPTPPIRMVNKFETPQPTDQGLLRPVADTGGPRATGNEGRPATWTNERVIQLAGQGNRDAIAQVGRRGLELPENARYVAGDVDFPRVVLNPKNVTRFTPEGTPIRQVGQGGRIIIEPNNPTGGILQPIESPQGPLATDLRKTAGQSPTGVERRSIRDITGPDPMRQAYIMDQQKVLTDPRSTPEDKAIAQQRIDDAKAHPFEQTSGKVDFFKDSRTKNEKRMTREEAEKESANRTEGRTARFAKPTDK